MRIMINKTKKRAQNEYKSARQGYQTTEINQSRASE